MSQKVFTFQYGKGIMQLGLDPERVRAVLMPKEVKPPADPLKEIASALANPLGTPPLRELLNRGRKATIIVPDITRKAAVGQYLPVLLREMEQAGYHQQDIQILFALGIHRTLSLEEQKWILGAASQNGLIFENHDCSNRHRLKFLGTTSRGTPVAINKKALETDLLILTGAINFHYFAGFSGGRKALLPGVAGKESCMANHLLVFQAQGGRHPQVKTAVLEGNPVHEDMMEAVRLCRPDFLLNTILSPQGETLKVSAGDWQEAFMQGCKFYKDNFSAEIKQPADLVITSCGGYPKDINFIQSHKTIEFSFGALKEGGVMIVLAQCSDGIGNPTFLDWFRYQNLQEFEAILRARFEINGQTAYSMLYKAKKVKIILVSDLPPEEVKKMSAEPARNLTEAFALAKTYLPEDYQAYLIPYGANLLPVVRN